MMPNDGGGMTQNSFFHHMMLKPDAPEEAKPDDLNHSSLLNFPGGQNPNQSSINPLNHHMFIQHRGQESLKSLSDAAYMENHQAGPGMSQKSYSKQNTAQLGANGTDQQGSQRTRFAKVVEVPIGGRGRSLASGSN